MTEKLLTSRQHVFGPTDICAMQTALESALGALAFSFAKEGPDTMTREELARAILRYAARGELNPVRLTARALHDLAPRPAYWVATRDDRLTA
ncbi:MAG: hypothetical protein JWO64_149 [Hyphomicrobiales bacterium]|jgi:hypothetical protein|nr:hypothetical protein [Hyphomicrobiales bacterium]